MIDLDGRVALVTGGARGIGRGVGAALLDAGAEVILASRTHADLDAARDELGPVTTHACDVADPRQVAALFAAVDERHGRLDVLVCSHGVYVGTRSALAISLHEYERTMAVNVTGTFLCAQHAARAMVAQGCGGLPLPWRDAKAAA